jgi:hypothetical protein
MSDPRQTNLPLNYASVRLRRASRLIYWVVIGLGAAPMMLGPIVLLIFWLTRSEWTPQVTGVMAGGLSWCIVLGGMGLIMFRAMERRLGRLTPEEIKKKVRLGIVLLLINFPVGTLYLLAPGRMLRRITVTVVNQGTRPVDSFKVTQSGVTAELGPVAPGSTVSRTYNISLVERLKWQARQYDKVGYKEFEGLGGEGMGGDVNVSVNDGAFSIK